MYTRRPRVEPTTEVCALTGLNPQRLIAGRNLQRTEPHPPGLNQFCFVFCPLSCPLTLPPPPSMCSVVLFRDSVCVDTFSFSCSPRLFNTPRSLALRKFSEIRSQASRSLPFRPPRPRGGTRAKGSCSLASSVLSLLPSPPLRPARLRPKPGHEGALPGLPLSVQGRARGRTEPPPLPRPPAGASLR